MNIYNAAFHALQNAQNNVERFKQPLAGDFFLWCRENTQFRDVQLSLSACKVEVDASHDMSVLKERLEKGIEHEKKRPIEHFTFDKHRLPLLGRIMAAVELFEREVV